MYTCTNIRPKKVCLPNQKKKKKSVFAPTKFGMKLKYLQKITRPTYLSYQNDYE